jgi:hypothetical protein
MCVAVLLYVDEECSLFKLTLSLIKYASSSSSSSSSSSLSLSVCACVFLLLSSSLYIIKRSRSNFLLREFSLGVRQLGVNHHEKKITNKIYFLSKNVIKKLREIID